MGTLFKILFYQPAFNLLIFFYRLFGDNLGIAIILLAIFTRLITYPMTKAQLKSAEKNKEFQAAYEKIKKKYGKNKQKFNEEVAKMQAKYLPGQVAGCLPIILMIIFLIQVRNVIKALVDNGIDGFNSVAYPFMSHFSSGETINFHFLGMDLSKVATNFSWSSSAIIPYVLLAVFVGLTQYISTKILSGIRTPTDQKSKDTKKKKGKKKAEEDIDMSEMMNLMNKQMMFVFPLMTTITSLGYWGGANFFPSGISIFWTIQNLFVIIQRLITNRKDVVFWVKSKFGKTDKKEKINLNKKQNERSRKTKKS